MTREERLQLNRDRQKAVRDAWAREKELINQGKGTVDWTADQQREIQETGRVKGYEGQHMKSCSQYPVYAKEADNIQLLSHEDHLAAHNCEGQQGGYRNPTNGYYDARTGSMEPFGENPPRAPKELELSDPKYQGHETIESENMSQEREMTHMEEKLSSNEVVGQERGISR